MLDQNAYVKVTVLRIFYTTDLKTRNMNHSTIDIFLNKILQSSHTGKWKFRELITATSFLD